MNYRFCLFNVLLLIVIDINMNVWFYDNRGMFNLKKFSLYCISFVFNLMDVLLDS